MSRRYGVRQGLVIPMGVLEHRDLPRGSLVSVEFRNDCVVITPEGAIPPLSDDDRRFLDALFVRRQSFFESVA